MWHKIGYLQQQTVAQNWVQTTADYVAQNWVRTTADYMAKTGYIKQPKWHKIKQIANVSPATSNKNSNSSITPFITIY